MSSTADSPVYRRLSLRHRVVILVWSAALVAGVGAMLHYEFTPVETAAPPNRWPVSTSLKLADARPTIVMFVHPRCPCSRASLSELAALYETAPATPRLYVLFLRPEGMPAGWEQTGLWEAALAIPDAHVLPDPGGLEAARFHARGSGQTLLYDSAGSLMFQGGITAGRGHAGDNAGRAAVESLLRGERPCVQAAPVFGCSFGRTASPATTSRTDAKS